ncbi:MAG: PqqD family peptide modification chaperone [Candidatus Omnitrophota bacterium]
MGLKVSLKAIYAPSEDVVARDVQGEFIIIPITSGIGDDEDNIFTLNETGRAVWDKLDSKKSLKEVVDCLRDEFDAPRAEIEADVLGVTKELLKRKIVIKI